MSGRDEFPSNPDPARAAGRQLEQWAALIAAGEAEFPADLPAGDEAALLQAVRRLRRARLITHLARQVALSLHEQANHARRTAGRNYAAHDGTDRDPT